MKLICPICHEPLYKENKSAICKNHHTFDYAKQGYLNLYLTNNKDHGDDSEMVHTRTSFLNTGAYSFLQEYLRTLTTNLNPDILLDLGCGEGYYTKALYGKEKYGFDLSKTALKHASKTDPTSQYILSSIFHIPMKNESADVITTCFAPVSPIEIEHLLKKDGYFILVTPGPRHLYELKEVLYEHPYENVAHPLDTKLKLLDTRMIERTFLCVQPHIHELFQMTPYYWHTRKEDSLKLNHVQSLKITAQFIIRVYGK